MTSSTLKGHTIFGLLYVPFCDPTVWSVFQWLVDPWVEYCISRVSFDEWSHTGTAAAKLRISVQTVFFIEWFHLSHLYLVTFRRSLVGIFEHLVSNFREVITRSNVERSKYLRKSNHDGKRKTKFNILRMFRMEFESTKTAVDPLSRVWKTRNYIEGLRVIHFEIRWKETSSFSSVYQLQRGLGSILQF